MFLKEKAIEYIEGELNRKAMLLRGTMSGILSDEEYERIAVEKVALEYALEVLQKGDD